MDNITEVDMANLLYLKKIKGDDGQIYQISDKLTEEKCLELIKKIYKAPENSGEKTGSIGKYIMNNVNIGLVDKLTNSIKHFGDSGSDVDSLVRDVANYYINNWIDQNTIFRISYVGNISSNIDITSIKEAALYFEKKIEFVICGDGPLFEFYKKKFNGISNVKFPGRVNHLKAAGLYELSQAMIIPYKNSKDFQLSLPNKFIDALTYGLPVISPLSGEVAKMINKHNIGISYGKPFNVTLIDALNTLLNNDLNEIVNNSKKIYHEEFSFEKVYNDLTNHLIKLKNIN